MKLKLEEDYCDIKIRTMNDTLEIFLQNPLEKLKKNFYHI